MNLALEEATIYRKTKQRLLDTQIALPFPDSLPDGVRCIEEGGYNRVWRIQRNQHRGLLVMADVTVKSDDKLWYHVSFSRAKNIPTYADCLYVKEVFVGADRCAIQIFPERRYHVNFHPFCLHLYSCLEERSIPEFSKNGMI